ncbi:hypothetical protein UlMin_024040 [Ulmus minor]
MACRPLFSPNSIPFPTTKTSNYKHIFPSCPFLSSSKTNEIKKRELVEPISVASIPYQPINVDYLETEFSGHGVTFEGIGDDCVAKMGLENGSSAILMLPSGLITSYKAAMWHGGTDEMLQSSVAAEEDGGAAVQGGVSLALDIASSDGVSWSPSYWALQNIRGNSQESIQVELVSTDSGNMVEVKYIVTLQEDVISSEIIISNSNSSSIQLTGCVLSHLRVSSPDATYAVGLEGSDFFIRPPILSDFGIVPPDFGQKNEFGYTQLLNQIAFWGSGSQSDDDGKNSNQRSEEEIDGEETDNYKHLRDQMSLIYTSAPRNFTVIDRGRRNSVVVGREGFDELYMLSPGSGHEFFSKYSYVCVGQSAMLKPLIVEPEEVLRVAQHLHNPNL